MGATPEQGRFAEVPLARLLLDLHRRRFTGLLRLSRTRVSKSVRLLGGLPVLVESNRSSESLARHLLASGRLSEAQRAQVVERTRDGRRAEAAVLLQLGVLGPKELVVALRDQGRRALLECFSWSDGEWALEPGEAPAEQAALLRHDPVALVLEGIESHWSPERLLEDLAPKLGRHPSRGEGWARVQAQLPADEGIARLCEAIDGTRTLDEAIRAAATARALAVAWILDAAGVVVHGEAAAATVAAEAPAAAPAAPELEIVIERRQAPRAAAARSSGPAHAASGGGAAADAASEALRQEILGKHAKLDELDHYALLDLARDAKPARVKRAYFAAAKRFHPDALVRLGLDDVREPASQVFAKMVHAHEVLSDPNRRMEYDGSLGGDDDAEAARLIQAETLFRKGDILLRAGQFGPALEFLRPAVELWPEDATYRLTLAWALFKNRPPDLKAAREHLERAIELEPQSAPAHARLASVLKALGEDAAAERALATARGLDPKAV